MNLPSSVLSKLHLEAGNSIFSSLSPREIRALSIQRNMLIMFQRLTTESLQFQVCYGSISASVCCAVAVEASSAKTRKTAHYGEFCRLIQSYSLTFIEYGGRLEDIAFSFIVEGQFAVCCLNSIFHPIPLQAPPTNRFLVYVHNTNQSESFLRGPSRFSSSEQEGSPTNRQILL